MLSISVNAANSEEGRQDLREFDKLLNREFDKLLNREFLIKEKSFVEFNKTYYEKEIYLNTKKTTFNKVVNESTLLQAVTSTAFAVPIQDTIYGQQQSNIIHQANVYQGVNLIYAVDTDYPNRRL